MQSILVQPQFESQLNQPIFNFNQKSEIIQGQIKDSFIEQEAINKNDLMKVKSHLEIARSDMPSSKGSSDE